MYLDLLLAFVSKLQIYDNTKLTIPSFNRQVCEDFNRSLLLLLNNRNTSHYFFSRVSIIPIPLHLLGKETYQAKKQVSIDNFTLLLQVTISIDIQYTNLWTDQQAYSIDCCTGLYTYWSKQQMPIDNFTYLLVKQQVGIDRQFHVPIGHRTHRFTWLLVTVIGIDPQCDIPIVRAIAYCADLSEPIGRRNRYRQPDSHLYSIVPIYLDILVQAIGIDRQIRTPIEGVDRYRHAISKSIDIPIGIFNSLLSRACYTSKPLPQYSCRVYYLCNTYCSVYKI